MPNSNHWSQRTSYFLGEKITFQMSVCILLMVLLSTHSAYVNGDMRMRNINDKQFKTKNVTRPNLPQTRKGNVDSKSNSEITNHILHQESNLVPISFETSNENINNNLTFDSSSWFNFTYAQIKRENIKNGAFYIVLKNGSEIGPMK